MTRAPDTDRFGVPPSAVLDARPVSAGERVEFADEVEIDETDLQAVESLARADEGWSLNPLNWLRGPGATAVLVVLGATLVLFIVSQIVGVLASIETLAPLARYGVYALMGAAVLAIVLALGRLVLSYARFKATPRYSFAAMQELANRADLREDARSDLDRATKHLAALLREYPAETDEDRAALVRVGFKPAQADELSASRRMLLAEYRELAPSAWLERYRTMFARPVDDAAKRLIRRRSLLVGAKTAAVPHGGLDTAILLTHAYLMIGDLCKLYRVRTNRAGTIAIMWRVLVAAFVAARLDDLTDEAANQITQAMTSATSGTIARASSAVAGKVVGKAAEGVVNATFTYRLGRAAMIRLRPLD